MLIIDIITQEDKYEIYNIICTYNLYVIIYNNYFITSFTPSLIRGVKLVTK